jgi:hypothetical protein
VRELQCVKHDDAGDAGGGEEKFILTRIWVILLCFLGVTVGAEAPAIAAETECASSVASLLS